MNLGDAFGALKGTPRKLSGLGGFSPVLPPRFALVEMAVLAAFVLAEYAIDGFPALTRFNPHPYWIAVLLLSLQYGTVSGLMAASLAILGSILIGMPEPDIDERYFNYLIRVWTQPVLWLLVAMLLGTFRARQIEQRDELLHQVDDLRSRGATLFDHATNLKARCLRLERHIATHQTADAGQLLSALGRLGEAEPGRWAPALKAALAAGFPGAQLSLYAIDGDKVRHVLTHGAEQRGAEQSLLPGSPARRVAAEIEPASPLLAAVVGAGRAVSVLDPADDDALAGHGVAAVPIFADLPGGGARVIGLLKADVLPPAQIDASTTRRLGVVAAHLAPALMQGRLTPVAVAGAIAVAEPMAATGLDATIPTVRRWRMLRWLPGGRPAVHAAPEDSNG